MKIEPLFFSISNLAFQYDPLCNSLLQTPDHTLSVCLPWGGGVGGGNVLLFFFLCEVSVGFSIVSDNPRMSSAMLDSLHKMELFKPKTGYLDKAFGN